METTSQNGNNSSSSDGGGGGGGSTALLLRTLRDNGRLQHRTHHAQDGHNHPGESQEAPTVLSLDQIRATRTSNEYTEGPTVAPRPPASQPGQQKSPTTPGLVNDEQPELINQQSLRLNQRNLLPQNQRDATTTTTDTRSHSLGNEDARSGVRMAPNPLGSSSSSSSSSPVVGERIIRTQPKQVELKQQQEELKPLTNNNGLLLVAVPGGGGGADTGERLLDNKHACCCKDCGRCVCQECVRPRPLPSCWMCGRRCVCSAQNVVEYGSCVCCVKGLFYHCSSDDEDTCADKPFSCSQSHCCVRWSAVGLLSLFLPCLLCYLPAKGCLAACQSCYDLATRPGCRCKNTNCKCLVLWRDT